ncbi:ATP-binding cassette domain-containing protein [Adhaeribacter swui]|uniref:ATP-binding cassette domain-containing protein n=1 Tax=Adhaeribacter swui TaxID=2086471 RepID=A0A7G7GAP2_9BACT|nr:ATP-binding cassette domain-containing protein [Adhaeribacter swui]QNF34226.1 ATP-binding cassette domain-containing protein [Adhaeribacter swui]
MDLTLLPAINKIVSQLQGLSAAPTPAKEPLTLPVDKPASVPSFLAYLQETAIKEKLIYVLSEPTTAELPTILEHSKSPVVLCQVIDNQVVPVVIQRQHNHYHVYRFRQAKPEKLTFHSVEEISQSCYQIPNRPEGQTYLLTSLVHQPPGFTDADQAKKPSHLGRLFKFLAVEKSQIGYIYIYAAIAGIISLSLPLGIQSIIGFVSGGQMSTSIVVLIGFIVVGIFAVGGLQIMQVYLVEHLQQRLFSRMSFDFAHRIPRLQLESLQSEQPVELMNRFFETLTLQKGIAKILLEFNAALLQILFGLILLSLYHSSFIFFGIFLAATLSLIIYATGNKGVQTSLVESKYKYQLVSWLESMARAIYTFKMASYSNLGMQQTDYITSQYILARRQHFSVLMTQYWGFIFFKSLITAGLLILGCYLVLQRQINIGQFVASEIIIILTMNSVEKIILKLDVVYDVLTGLKKITAVTDLPLEEARGLKITETESGPGISVQAAHLAYHSPSEAQIKLHDINLKINASEKVALTGISDAGKFTLSQILLGLTPGYEGRLAYNNLSLRDLDVVNLRSQMAAIIATDQIFEGTLLQNITCGESNITTQEVLEALEICQLSAYVQNLPKGLHTVLTGTDWQLPRSVVSKIMLARCLVRKPKLVVLDNNLLAINRAEKLPILQALHQRLNCTLIIISHDKKIMQFCDRVMLMQEGTITHQGTYTAIQPHLPLTVLTETTV